MVEGLDMSLKSSIFLSGWGWLKGGICCNPNYDLRSSVSFLLLLVQILPIGTGHVITVGRGT